MAGYLEQYGVGDARRARRIKTVVIAVLSVAVVSTVLFFVFRNFREKRQVSRFIDLLKQHDYKAAYVMWGCVQPCKDYSYEKFLQDWGEASPFGKPDALKIQSAQSCESGSVVTVQGNGQEREVNLWVERTRGYTLGFSPWPVCNPIIRVPTAQ